jgi:hypothetical protein
VEEEVTDVSLNLFVDEDRSRTRVPYHLILLDCYIQVTTLGPKVATAFGGPTDFLDRC